MITITKLLTLINVHIFSIEILCTLCKFILSGSAGCYKYISGIFV